MSKKYTIITYGCQMNEHDSEQISYILENLEYTYTNAHEPYRRSKPPAVLRMSRYIAAG